MRELITVVVVIIGLSPTPSHALGEFGTKSYNTAWTPVGPTSQGRVVSLSNGPLATIWHTDGEKALVTLRIDRPETREITLLKSEVYCGQASLNIYDYRILNVAMFEKDTVVKDWNAKDDDPIWWVSVKPDSGNFMWAALAKICTGRANSHR